MKKALKHLFCIFGFLIISTIANSTISGKVLIDSTWNNSIYLSLITNFNNLHSISNQMIIDMATINTDGVFSFNTEYLPARYNLYRIHVSKKGDPPASLIIGGKDENHMFLIANRSSDIIIKNSDSENIFSNIVIENSTQSNLLNEVNKMLLYVDTTNFYNTPLKRELMENAMDEKLRQFADTCSYPLVALYAIYRSNFESHVKSNPDFYIRFLEKWQNEKSSYFKKFRETVQIKKSMNYSSILYSILGFGIGIIFMLFILNRKNKITKNPVQDLTVQERNIFGLLQQGKSNKEISDELNISLSTVKSHVNNIFSKMNLKSRKEILN